MQMLKTIFDEQDKAAGVDLITTTTTTSNNTDILGSDDVAPVVNEELPSPEKKDAAKDEPQASEKKKPKRKRPSKSKSVTIKEEKECQTALDLFNEIARWNSDDDDDSDEEPKQRQPEEPLDEKAKTIYEGLGNESLKLYRITLKKESEKHAEPNSAVHAEYIYTPRIRHMKDRRGIKRKRVDDDEELIVANNFENKMHLRDETDFLQEDYDAHQDSSGDEPAEDIEVPTMFKDSSFVVPRQIFPNNVLTPLTANIPRLRKKRKLFHDTQDSFKFTFELTQANNFTKEGKQMTLPQKVQPKEFCELFEKVMSDTLLFQPTMAVQEFVQQYRTEYDDLRSGFDNTRSRKMEDNEVDIKKRWARVVGHIPKEHRNFTTRITAQYISVQNLAIKCQSDVLSKLKKSQRLARDCNSRAKKMAKDMSAFWKKYDKELSEKRKKKQKEDGDKKKREHEMNEAKRQQRKLNFLLTQTELYTHFMASKSRGETDQSSAPASALPSNLSLQVGEEDAEGLTAERAMTLAQRAVNEQLQRTQSFDVETNKYRTSTAAPQMPPMPPSIDDQGEHLLPPPSIFKGKLKNYQLKGFNWLVTLYNSGINGILADEMGLGKTVQTICFLSYIAEVHGIWGPFLIISPSSTLHNWQQEFQKFSPNLRVLPYWGGPKERKMLRKHWAPNKLYNADSPFHVCITSYGLILEDEKSFNKIKWQYLILDEAHAIKSSKSARWQTLLNFKCRNRMLLTGTPIQNNMAELWALLHFIMPSLFDSHDEFSEWFAKDIESHAVEEKGSLDQQQLTRLHMILKPFMLRRVKKDVETEMAPKIEQVVYCGLSSKQRSMYKLFKDQITRNPNMASLLTADQSSTKSLMNYVMQFRKVCNHPDLFIPQSIHSPLQFVHPSPATKVLPVEVLGYVPQVRCVNRNLIEFAVPKMLYREGLLGLGEITPECGDIDNLKKRYLIYNKLNIWQADTIHRSLTKVDPFATFSFTRFLDLTIPELLFLAKATPLEVVAMLVNRQSRLERLHYLNDEPDVPRRPGKLLIVEPNAPTLPTHTNSSSLTQESRQVWHDLIQHDAAERFQSSIQMYKKLDIVKTKVLAPAIKLFCPDRNYTLSQAESKFDLWQKHVMNKDPLLTPIVSRRFTPVTCNSFPVTEYKKHIVPFATFAPTIESERTGLFTPYHSLSNRIRLTSVSKLVADSGKLQMLDKLLLQLKQEGHRVLIFCQMTKMLDILEDYMYARHYKFYRLDGSTTVSDRRDMVDAFQTRGDIFAFLLSTRAGGLGINLTAADTVIFYDNDWNPTLDAQAMDRVHRIGQTKQVTIYRMIIKGTVEDRILKIAQQKSTIQNTVYSGQFKQEADVTRENVVSVLLDDLELDRMQLQKQQQQQELRGRQSAAARAAWIKKRKTVDDPAKPRKKPGPKKKVPDAANGTQQPAAASTTVAPKAPANGTQQAAVPSAAPAKKKAPPKKRKPEGETGKEPPKKKAKTAPKPAAT